VWGAVTATGILELIYGSIVTKFHSGGMHLYAMVCELKGVREEAERSEGGDRGSEGRGREEAGGVREE